MISMLPSVLFLKGIHAVYARKQETVISLNTSLYIHPFVIF